MNDRKLLLRTLDNPLRVLYWSIDEFMVLAFPLFLTLCLGSIFFVLIGFVLKPCYSKFKKNFPNGSFVHKLYWYLPTKSIGRVKHLPASYYRELLL
jgi:conjugal transfer pilus assembly protein TraL